MKEESDTFGHQVGSLLDIGWKDIAPEIQEVQEDITPIRFCFCFKEFIILHYLHCIDDFVWIYVFLHYFQYVVFT